MRQNIARPLAGKRIVITRAPEQSTELISALEALGAEIFLMPTMRFLPPENWAHVDSAIEHIHEFDWILFTSKNALRFLTKRIFLSGKRDILQRLRIGAVGPKTLILAKAEGLNVDFVPQHHTGEALARELGSELAGKRVLLPRSDRADDRLPAALRDIGAKVTEVIAYRTTSPETLDPEVMQRVQNGGVDVIVFASPSSFHNLCDWIPAEELARLSRDVQFAVIGPTTAEALRKAEVHVAIEADDASSAGIANAIVSYYEKHPAITRQP